MDFNKSLKKVQSDVSEQIKILQNTLVQTKVFEEKVSEQLKIEKKRFERESADVLIYPSDLKFVDTVYDDTKYALNISLKNKGVRAALDINYDWFIFIFNQERKLVAKYRSNPNLKRNGSARGNGLDILNEITDAVIPKELVIGSNNTIISVFNISYKDESDEKIIRKNLFFRWEDTKANGLYFHSSVNFFNDLVVDYVRTNKLKGVLVE